MARVASKREAIRRRLAVSGTARNIPVTPQSARHMNSHTTVTVRLRLSVCPAIRGRRMFPTVPARARAGDREDVDPEDRHDDEKDELDPEADPTEEK
jgi:hypothetical protein